MKKNFSALIALLLAAPAFAEPLTDAWQTLSKLKSTRSTASAPTTSGSELPNGCSIFKELETRYEMTFRGGGNSLVLHFSYTSCQASPDYTNRMYNEDFDSRYQLMIETDNHANTSRIVLVVAGELSGRSNPISNSKLTSDQSHDMEGLRGLAPFLYGFPSATVRRISPNSPSKSCPDTPALEKARYVASVALSNDRAPLIVYFDYQDCVVRTETGVVTHRLYRADQAGYRLIISKPKDGNQSHISLTHANSASNNFHNWGAYVETNAALLSDKTINLRFLSGMETVASKRDLKTHTVVAQAQIRRLP